MLITQACKSLNAVCEAKQSTQLEMQRLAAMLPEYEVVMRMEGAGPVTGPALMAEIGDVRRFKNKKALVAFAGIDAPPFQSGAFESKSRHVSKRGSPHLRRTIFIISNIILTRSNPENSVYCFMDKKRSEGKPSSNIENHMTVCMEYPAKSPYEDEPENAAGKGQEHHAERTA